MNVFMLSMDHDQRASYYRDDHVNKMLVEAVQIMNNALHIHDRSDLAFYGASHLHHPWSEWAAESVANWAFLDDHARALGQEYLHRSKYRDEQQAADRKREEHWSEPERSTIGEVLPDRSLTSFPVCTGEFDPDSDWVIEQYRDYYANVKCEGERAVWTDRPRPDWIDEYR